MTPKEKAKELVDKFDNYVETEDFFGDSRVLENSKQCALIAVDEILEALEKVAYWQSKGQFKYYEEVKQEIEKI